MEPGSISFLGIGVLPKGLLHYFLKGISQRFFLLESLKAYSSLGKLTFPSLWEKNLCAFEIEDLLRASRG